MAASGRYAARCRWPYARAEGIANLILPLANAAEAAVVEGVRVFGVRHLAEVVKLVTQPESFPATAKRALESRGGGWAQCADDRSTRLRQDNARQAAGGHPSAPDVRRIHRDHQGPQRRRIAAWRRGSTPCRFPVIPWSGMV